MAIISQETWNKFTEEEKEKIRKDYRDTLKEINNDDSEADIEYKTYVSAAEMYFGKENLQPKIRSWKDCQKMNEDSNFFMRIDDNLELSDKVYSKCIATLKIAKLIELGYGGMVTAEKWKDDSIEKFSVVPCDVRDGFKIVTCYYNSDKNIIAFHTYKQAEEFMSYPENVELVRQYYML